MLKKVFERLQFVSAGLYSLGHGGIDAQKTMGIITLLLLSAGVLDSAAPFHVPLWVVLSCQFAMALGTLMGGWRIVKTMGFKLAQLRPIDGFSAESAGACTLFMANYLGVPVSTTHTITGAIMGVGSVKGLRKVQWGMARWILWAWVLTIPFAAFVAALSWYILSLLPV